MKKLFTLITLIGAYLLQAQSDTIKTNKIEAVSIVAKKPTVESKVDRTVFNVANSSILAGNTTWDVLRMTPHVSIDNNDVIKAEGENVAVYINDRKTAFTGKELKEYLLSIPAENLMKIEVITSPSAKYESSGVVINIVLKKREDEGIKGSLSLTNSQSNKNSQYGNFNINYHKGKFTQSLSGSYNNYNYNNNYEGENKYYESGLISHFKGENKDRGFMPSLNLASEWEINDKNNVGFIIEAFQNKRLKDALSDGADFQQEVLENIFSRSQQYRGLYRYMENNLFYKYYDKEKNRIFDVNIGFNYNDNGEENQYWENGSSFQSPVYTTVEKNMIARNYFFKVDYSHAFGEDLKNNFELGSKINWNYNTIPTNLSGNNQNLFDIQPNDVFYYHDNLNMFYANLSMKFWKKLDTRIGLRYEYFRFNIQQKVAKETRKDDYGIFLPNVLLKYTFTPNFNISASYNRNIWRPWYTEFNPFLVPGEVAGIYVKGNLDLQPNISNRLNMKAGLYKKYYLSFTYWFTDKDYWDNYVIVDGKSVKEPANFNGKVENYMVNLNTNQNFLNDKLNVNLNIGYNFINNTDFNRRNNLSAQDHLSNFNGSANFTYTNLFNKNINVNVWMGMFKHVSGNSYNNTFNFFNNISITKIMEKQGIELSLKLNNIFKKPAFDSTTYTAIGSFSAVYYSDWSGVSFSIVKRFGNQKVKENTKTDVEKEQGGGK